MKTQTMKIGDKKQFNNLAELQVFSEEYNPKKGEFRVSFNNNAFFVRKILMLILFFSVAFTQAQVCSSADTEEHYIVSFFVDPSASIKEGGLNFGLEVGLEGNYWYANAQIESFEALTGGYFSYGAAVGLHLQSKKIHFKLGGRLIVTHRNGGMRPMYGVEGSITYDINERWFVGIRGTYDYRIDMELLDYPVIWRESGFVTLGYKFEI